MNYSEQNRPVHLALRDVHYERVTQRLKAPPSETLQAPRVVDYEEILFLLRIAREQGRFALRHHEGKEKDEQFNRFINMLAGNVKAVLSMLNLKHSVEEKDSFFFSFLEVNHASVALQAEEYERRARDIIRSMQATLELASDAYEGLRQADFNALSDSERERYNKAATHHRELIEKRPELPEYKKHDGLFA